MSSLKWGIFAGIAALIISIALGIISGVGPGYIFLRGFIFAVVFFGIGFGIRIIINSYFPEILYFDEEKGPSLQDAYMQSGQRINITLGSSGEYAVPEMYRSAPDAGELGNIEELISGSFKPVKEGIDRKREEDYNIQGEAFSEPQFTPTNDLPEFASRPVKEVPVEKPVFTPTFGDDSDDLGALPDLGSLATVFSSRGDEAGAGESSALGLGGGFSGSFQPLQEEDMLPAGGGDQPQSYNKGNKASPIKGDFNPKELAEGIRTILTMDKQG